jgi:excisionase family DNA binding protein
MKNTITNVDELPLSITVEDVGKIMGLSKNNAYTLCHSKGFPCVVVGRRMIIPKLAFIKWLENPKLL